MYLLIWAQHPLSPELEKTIFVFNLAFPKYLKIGQILIIILICRIQIFMKICQSFIYIFMYIFYMYTYIFICRVNRGDFATFAALMLSVKCDKLLPYTNN